MFSSQTVTSLTRAALHREPGTRDVHRVHRPSAHKRQYEQRKAAGKCAQSGCSDNAASGHQYCHHHLKRMSQVNKARVAARKRRGLCIHCGTRPQFWGVRCIICRQRFAKNLLPSGAKRALKRFRDAEKQFEVEQIEVRARLDVRKLLARGDIRGDRARALMLYAGLDNGQWRTYLEVGEVMGLSKERVRQLLQPSKIELTRLLNNKVPWRINGRVRVRSLSGPVC